MQRLVSLAVITMLKCRIVCANSHEVGIIIGNATSKQEVLVFTHQFTMSALGNDMLHRLFSAFRILEYAQSAIATDSALLIVHLVL